MKRVLLTCTATRLSRSGALRQPQRQGYLTGKPTVTERIDNAFTDLSKTVQAPIPHAALHARALEILRERTVAKDDGPSFDELARVDNCVAFVKTTMEKVNCVK